MGLGGFFSDFGGTLLDGALDFGFGLFNDYRSRKASKKAYERQLMFSNSAHQREVRDLIAAGLNPILSTHGNGAASISVPVAHGEMRKGNYGANINSARTINKQNDLLEAQKNQADSVTALNTANSSLADANRDLVEAKTVAQSAQNVIEIGKSDFFAELPGPAKYDLVNAMLYPSSELGQIRGLAGSIVDGVTQSFKDAFTPDHNSSLDKLLHELEMELRQDAGSRGGHNSAKSARDEDSRRAYVKQRIEEITREQERKDWEFYNKNMKGKVL